MTIGTGTFLPSPKFSFVRSYVYWLAVATYGLSIDDSGDEFIIFATPPDPTSLAIGIDHSWRLWSSNGRTLDRIVTDFYAETPPSIVQHPVPFTLSYGSHPTNHNPTLFIDWFAGTPVYHFQRLPVQSNLYWLPKPLG